MTLVCRPLHSRFVGILAGLTVAIWFTGAGYGQTDRTTDNGPQIEYIAPDGKLSSLSVANPVAHQSSAAFIDSNTVSCALKEGETTFIIELPRNADIDRFTFLNQNAAACGELRIAVSNSPLPVDSPKWTEVDGIVPFAHKRLFKLSMLGIETKFVRLSFRVDGDQERSAKVSNPFRSSILAETINSHFTRLRGLSRELNFATISVAPLPAAAGK